MSVVHALPRDLPTLTALRAGAAVLVFGYHVGNTITPIPFAEVGYAGVAFFFVLSGFVLTWSFRPDATWGSFMIRRIARIYPSHAVMMALALVLCLTILHSPITPIMLGSQTLLLQAWLPDRATVLGMNTVSWSLSVELAFYALFPFLVPVVVRMRNRARWVLTLCLPIVPVAVGLTLSSTGHEQMTQLLYFNPLARVPEFVLGVTIALAIRDGRLFRIPFGVAVVATGVTWIVCSVADIPEYIGNSVLALAFGGVIAAVAARDITRVRVDGRTVPAWAIFAGRISFAFYLVHLLVLQVVVVYVWVPALAQVAGAFMVSALLATALHIWVERPAQTVIVRVWKVRETTRARREPERQNGVHTTDAGVEAPASEGKQS